MADCYRGLSDPYLWGTRPAEGQKDFVSTLYENLKAHSATVNDLDSAVNIVMYLFYSCGFRFPVSPNPYTHMRTHSSTHTYTCTCAR